METAGTISVKIPAVVSPDGRINASLYVTKNEQGELENQTDVGLLYDHWWDEPDTKLCLIHIKAEIDLDKVFGGREVESKVDVVERQYNPLQE